MKPISAPALRWWLGSLLVLALFPARVHATSVLPPDFSEMVNASDYIVRARVKSVSSEIIARNGRERIYTRVELDVLEVIAGRPPTPLILTMLGGKVGDEELVIHGAPKFVVGNEDILFIQGNGHTISPVYALMHGQFPVLHDEAKGHTYVCRSNLVPLVATGEVSSPMSDGEPAEVMRRLVDPSSALTPEEFIKSIRQARKPSSDRARQNR